jgi:hypothetical protein
MPSAHRDSRVGRPARLLQRLARSAGDDKDYVAGLDQRGTGECGSRRPSRWAENSQPLDVRTIATQPGRRTSERNPSIAPGSAVTEKPPPWCGGSTSTASPSAWRQHHPDRARRRTTAIILADTVDPHPHTATRRAHLANRARVSYLLAVGCAVTPRMCTRRMTTSITTSTYSRRSVTVSRWKKSVASSPDAWAWRKARHEVSVLRRRADSDRGEKPADRARTDPFGRARPAHPGSGDAPRKARRNNAAGAQVPR